MEAFYRALGAKDTTTACGLVAYSGIPLSGDDLVLCRSGFDAVVTQVATSEELGQLRTTTVTGATIDGARAQVRAEDITGLPAAYRQAVSLVLVGGRWFIESPLT